MATQNNIIVRNVSNNEHFKDERLRTIPLRPNDLLRMEEKARNLYDVIVCGGGTAGCVIAARLTEEPNNKVLLIECGSDAWRSMESNWEGLNESGEPIYNNLEVNYSSMRLNINLSTNTNLLVAGGLLTYSNNVSRQSNSHCYSGMLRDYRNVDGTPNMTLMNDRNVRQYWNENELLRNVNKNNRIYVPSTTKKYAQSGNIGLFLQNKTEEQVFGPALNDDELELLKKDNTYYGNLWYTRGSNLGGSSNTNYTLCRRGFWYKCHETEFENKGLNLWSPQYIHPFYNKIFNKLQLDRYGNKCYPESTSDITKNGPDVLDSHPVIPRFKSFYNQEHNPITVMKMDDYSATTAINMNALFSGAYKKRSSDKKYSFPLLVWDSNNNKTTTINTFENLIKNMNDYRNNNKGHESDPLIARGGDHDLSQYNTIECIHSIHWSNIDMFSSIRFGANKEDTTHLYANYHNQIGSCDVNSNNILNTMYNTGKYTFNNAGTNNLGFYRYLNDSLTNGIRPCDNQTITYRKHPNTGYNKMYIEQTWKGLKVDLNTNLVGKLGWSITTDVSGNTTVVPSNNCEIGQPDLFSGFCFLANNITGDILQMLYITEPPFKSARGPDSAYQLYIDRLKLYNRVKNNSDPNYKELDTLYGDRYIDKSNVQKHLDAMTPIENVERAYCFNVPPYGINLGGYKGNEGVTCYKMNLSVDPNAITPARQIVNTFVDAGIHAKTHIFWHTRVATNTGYLYPAMKRSLPKKYGGEGWNNLTVLTNRFITKLLTKTVCDPELGKYERVYGVEVAGEINGQTHYTRSYLSGTLLGNQQLYRPSGFDAWRVGRYKPIFANDIKKSTTESNITNLSVSRYNLPAQIFTTSLLDNNTFIDQSNEIDYNANGQPIVLADKSIMSNDKQKYIVNPVRVGLSLDEGAVTKQETYDLDTKISYLADKAIIKDKAFGIYECRFEVVLCAGTFATPVILMRSGIGEKEQLDKFNIPVKANIPGIGKGLVDHPHVMFGFTSSPIYGWLNSYIKGFNAGIYRYILFGSFDERYLPLMQNTSMSVAIDTLDRGYADTTLDFFAQGSAFGGGSNAKAYGHFGGSPVRYYGDPSVISAGKSLKPATSVLVENMIGIKSSGYVELNSNDVFSPPNIVVNYCMNVEDLAPQVHGIKNIILPYLKQLYDNPFTRFVDNSPCLTVTPKDLTENAIKIGATSLIKKISWNNDGSILIETNQTREIGSPIGTDYSRHYWKDGDLVQIFPRYQYKTTNKLSNLSVIESDITQDCYGFDIKQVNNRSFGNDWDNVLRIANYVGNVGLKSDAQGSLDIKWEQFFDNSGNVIDVTNTDYLKLLNNRSPNLTYKMNGLLRTPGGLADFYSKNLPTYGDIQKKAYTKLMFDGGLSNLRYGKLYKIKVISNTQVSLVQTDLDGGNIVTKPQNFNAPDYIADLNDINTHLELGAPGITDWYMRVNSVQRYISPEDSNAQQLKGFMPFPYVHSVSGLESTGGILPVINSQYILLKDLGKYGNFVGCQYGPDNESLELNMIKDSVLKPHLTDVPHHFFQLPNGTRRWYKSDNTVSWMIYPDATVSNTAFCNMIKKYDNSLNILYVSGTNPNGAVNINSTNKMSFCNTSKLQLSVPQEVQVDENVWDINKLRNAIYQTLWGHHAMGTCRMGLTSDALSVCDQMGRVYNVSGVRVADCSLLPAYSSNTMTGAIVVGERISDFMIKDINYLRESYYSNNRKLVENDFILSTSNYNQFSHFDNLANIPLTTNVKQLFGSQNTSLRNESNAGYYIVQTPNGINLPNDNQITDDTNYVLDWSKISPSTHQLGWPVLNNVQTTNSE